MRQNKKSEQARMSSLISMVIVMLIVLSLSRPALSKLCNQDKQVLLQIKKELGNPTKLSSWLPTTDYCDTIWAGVVCITDSNNKTCRVDILDLSYLNLPKPYPIPPSIGNLPYLNYLYLSNTNFVGAIPSSIANLTNLNNLNIKYTNVSGTIPDFLFHLKTLVTIDLSYNNLSGNLPASLSSLPNLAEMTFTGNRISGPIPDSFGSFSEKLIVMRLSRNRLTGKIPATLAKLNLRFLDLSRNMLEGDASMLFGSEKDTVQINLGKNKLAFDLGKVKFPEILVDLDLRHNRIYGTLPQGLTALKHLTKLNVSNNNLCGEIPQGGNLQRIKVNSYAHNKCLCGSPLPSC